ncbi:hypothetical protein DFJ58DRAFT_845899 [Suillus subalutaceus]|uniref:uncharacterized protein n=1 Tax=Suillus subalutaceus TaxID=48586 RepID=UPI001B85DA15|nr:uncharacterized protein DFJ58DRAFT_845899 [Suillus subalutaceus]KAG1838856.1 hypothetical protein DFJ58DRAFT_845899 [Suillus subalutaceus]
MAVKQSVQVNGPPKLVQPWLRMVSKNKQPSKVNSFEPIVTLANPKSTAVIKRRHPGLKLTFRESVVTNHKVTNDGVTIVGNGKIKECANQKGLDGLDSELEGPITAWVDKIASWPQLKPSMPPSTTQPSKIHYLVQLDLKEPPEEFDEQPRRQGTKKPKGAVRIKKCSNAVIEAPDDLGSLADTEEDLKILKDLEAAEDENLAIEQSNLDDVESDAGQDDMMEDDDGKSIDMEAEAKTQVTKVEASRIKIESRVTSSMPVSITSENTTSKTDNFYTNIKKRKLKNSNLPVGVYDQWRAKFIPCVIYWIGNSDYGRSIPENELEVALEDIFDAVQSCEQGPSSFNAGGRAFAVATQRIYEWQATFSSTAISILMVFFSSEPEYKTQN